MSRVLNLAEQMDKLQISRNGDIWTLHTEHGRMSILDNGDGTGLAGDWECDGEDPYLALRLYRNMEKLADLLGLEPYLSAKPDERLDRFYRKMGWEPEQVIYGKRTKESTQGSK
jgi:hypothetical protein